MEPQRITELIRVSLPDAEVHCHDLTGTKDHWQLEVVSDAFAGKRLLAQHRLVKDALAAQLKDNSIHALSLKTFTFDKWKAEGGSQ